MSQNPNFLLTPQQQELLFAALNANRPSVTPNSLTVSPTVVVNPVSATKPTGITSSLDDSSFLDYDYSFEGDTSLDFSINDAADQSTFVEDPAEGDDSKTESAPSNDGNETPDKRSHPDDEDDETSAAKRRESTEKVPKKPGRKPLSTDANLNQPQHKRKAQNRAAQRAFRERKEKHLKDLEDKVAELEKVSEAANNENEALRAQVEKMTVELNEYKKRMSLLTKARPTYAPVAGHQLYGNPVLNNINDVNFQFEFPKFGQLPGPPNASHTTTATAATAATTATTAATTNTATNTSTDRITPPTSTMPGFTTASPNMMTNPADALKKASPREDLSKLSNAFTPPAASSNNAQNPVRGSMDSGSTSSPSASSHNSNTAPSSSCGTSPEPYTQSPMGYKAVDTLTTIGEEQPVPPTNVAAATTAPQQQDVPHFANVDLSDINWLDHQTNFQFDPQLFGDYREPQENVLASGGFDDSFFNDALDIDFTTPFNTALSPIEVGQQQQKSSLIAQIDAAKEGEFSSSSLTASSQASQVKADPEVSSNLTASGQYLTCNKIWEHLQNCPKVQNGDFDLDGLCSDLQKKAKCSGSGAVVDETDFKIVMKKYLDREPDSQCSKDFIANIKSAKA